MKNHQEYFRANKVAQVQRFNYENDDYPYRGHGQPFTAWGVFIFCSIILLVFNGACIWKKFYAEAFLSAYLTVSSQTLLKERGSHNCPQLICFMVLWLVLKIIRGAGVIPQLVDLSKPEVVLSKVKRFNQMRFRGADDEADPPNIWNLWGII
jgi:amino acid transporter